MELKKETLSRINKCNYNPKYHHSDIKVIMGSLRGTKYHSKENAEELLRLRGEGWRWNIVEDAIDAAHLAKCIPIIEKNFKLQQEHWEILEKEKKREEERAKNLRRRKEEENQYESELKQAGADGYYNDFLVKGILKYLNEGASFYAEIKVALMTIEHYQVKKKYPPFGNTIDESWNKDIDEIIEKIQTDKVWMKKVDAIIEEIHGEIKGNPIDVIEEVVKIDDEDYDESNAEEYFDDPQWYENQKGMSDQYNNRGTIDGIISHCDMDDIDDSNREEF